MKPGVTVFIDNLAQVLAISDLPRRGTLPSHRASLLELLSPHLGGADLKAEARCVRNREQRIARGMRIRDVRQHARSYALHVCRIAGQFVGQRTLLLNRPEADGPITSSPTSSPHHDASYKLVPTINSMAPAYIGWRTKR
jgi:hypothetical protein